MATMSRLELAFILVVLVTPTFCNAARGLRGWGRWSETHSLAEERHEFEKRSSNWSGQESGDDAVPASSSSLSAANDASTFKRWVRYQEDHVTDDYADTPAAANPSIPCC